MQCQLDLSSLGILETICCPLCRALEIYQYFLKLTIIVLSPVWTYPRHRPHLDCLHSKLSNICLQQASAVRILLLLLHKMILSWTSMNQIQSAWGFQCAESWSHLRIWAGRHVSDMALIFLLPCCLYLDWGESDFFCLV